jgi:polysaccharide deacetylase 2 family uncharacterized protein YibQ
MNMPGISARIATGIGGFLKSQSPGTLAASGITTLMVAMFLIVSLLGTETEHEPSTVLKIQDGFVSHTTQSGAPSLGTSLIAANGAVISDPALIEMSSDGPVPKIARDGRVPMEVYSRTSDRSDPRPKIALILVGLGLSESVTQSAIDQLPAGITFAFTPYGSALQAVVSTARANGHEVILEVPLEPYDYPDNDPGQNTLLTGTPAADNAGRLQWVLSRVTGYAGLINSQGSKYLASASDARFLLGGAKKRGLYFVDNGQTDQSLARESAMTVGAAFVRGDKTVDLTPTQPLIESELTQLEKLAQQRGLAVGIATAYPITIERVKVWALGLEQKGIALVPISAVVVTKTIAAAPKPISAPHAAQPHPAQKRKPAQPHSTHSADPGPHP